MLAVRGIEEWLEGLGLGEHAPRFVENDIDFTILGDLTDQDLEKIGVVSFGHRRKPLRAIAALNGAPAVTSQIQALPAETVADKLPAAPIAAKQPQSPHSADAAGERRHVTVLFCDLVDSTDIASRLDAEEWRDLVGGYLGAASAAVTEMGGTVAKRLGDGLMALFGHPAAHENDAERAVRAGLAIQRAMTELNRKNASAGKPALAARVGIETGPVVIDAAGEIFGDAPNVASRVQTLAEPDSVMVTAQVQRQIAGLFVAEDRGAHQPFVSVL
jgi:class 3 adenylate cyclase